MADDEIRPVIEYLNRFLHDLFIRTGGGDDIIGGIEEDNITGVANDAAFRAKLNRLVKRVGDLEDNDKSSILNGQITKLRAKVDRLIDELLTELRLQRPNEELERSAIELQIQLIKETRLLSARIEEAFDTGVEIDDIDNEE